MSCQAKSKTKDHETSRLVDGIMDVLVWLLRVREKRRQSEATTSSIWEYCFFLDVRSSTKMWVSFRICLLFQWYIAHVLIFVFFFLASFWTALGQTTTYIFWWLGKRYSKKSCGRKLRRWSGEVFFLINVVKTETVAKICLFLLITVVKKTERPPKICHFNPCKQAVFE